MINEFNKNRFSKKLEETLAVLAIFLITLNNTVTSFQILGVSIDRLAEIILFVIVFQYIKTYIFQYKDAYYFFLIICFFIFLKTFILLVESTFAYIDFETALRDIVRVLYFFIIFALAFFAFSILKLKALIFYLIFTAPYFLLAFSQHPLTPFTEFGFKIWEIFYINQLPETGPKDAGYLLRDYTTLGFLIRPVGPYESPIGLSYALLPAIIISAYVYFKTEKVRYYFLFIFLIVVGALTLTRSLIIGTFILFLYVSIAQLIFKRDRWILSLLLLSVFPLSYFIFSNQEFFLRIIDLTDVFTTEGSPRMIAWQSGFISLIENPLYFNSEGYLSLFNEGCKRSQDCWAIISMHNGFLRVGRDFSIFGLFIYLFFLGYLFYLSIEVNEKSIFKGLYFIGIISYIIHCFFHNNTLFISEYSILIFITWMMISNISLFFEHKAKE